jgi:hypothetical protein
MFSDPKKSIAYSGLTLRSQKTKAVPSWPYLGGVRFRDARPDHVQRLIATALASGYSTTVKHICNVVRAILALATKKRWFIGDNPASAVALPK